MPFKKGREKTGGIQKGGEHKLLDVLRICAETGADPFRAMAEIVADTRVQSDKHLRLAAAKELVKYMKPQLKAIEISGEIEAKPSVLILGDGRKLVFTNEENK